MRLCKSHMKVPTKEKKKTPFGQNYALCPFSAPSGWKPHPPVVNHSPALVTRQWGHSQKQKWEPQAPGKAMESPNVGSARRKGEFALLSPGPLRNMKTLSLRAKMSCSSACTMHKMIKRQTLPRKTFSPVLCCAANADFAKGRMMLHL